MRKPATKIALTARNTRYSFFLRSPFLFYPFYQRRPLRYRPFANRYVDRRAEHLRGTSYGSSGRRIMNWVRIRDVCRWYYVNKSIRKIRLFSIR